MANSDAHDAQFRAYLSRNLPDAELAAFAGRLLAETDLSDELREFEIEWVDARARGELGAEETAAVDAYLSQTGQLGRLIAARGLARGRSPAPPRRKPSAYWLAAAAAIILVIFALQSNRRAANLRTPVAASPTPVEMSPFAVLITPGTRSPAPRRVAVPPGTVRIELQLALDAPLPPGSYEARVQPESGGTVLSRTVALAPGDTSLRITLAVDELPPAAYRVLVFRGSSPDGPINAYSFDLASSTR